MRPYDLRCEYSVNPLGLDTTEPRFFWKLKAPVCRGAVQSARRIIVADNALFDPVLWDSGEVASPRSVHVEYAGPKLLPRTRYFWRVQAWDGNGDSDGWSESAWFETGMMHEGWQARWIGAEKGPGNAALPLLRREFASEGAIRSARIYASAKGLYRLYLNGQSVSDDLFAPGWTAYDKRIQYQTYDVTGMIRPGENALGAMLGCGWYASPLRMGEREKEAKPPLELLLELHISYTDGREQVVATSGDWKAADGPVLFSEICGGERYDARREIPGWSEPGVRQGKWREVTVEPEGGHGMLTAQEGLPVRRIEEVKPAALITTPKGEAVLDMGRDMTGFLRFRVSGQAGSRVVLRHFEALDKDGNACFENPQSAAQIIEYTLRGGGEETYEPYFTFQCFRYVLIEQWPGEPNIGAFTGIVVHSGMERTGNFSCSDGQVNNLQHTIVQWLQGNLLDVPTDCPRGGRLGWAGDTQVFLPTACFNFFAVPFYAKWLRDMAAGQREDGSIPLVIPAATGGDSSSGWADTATVCPWTLYEYYEDKRLLRECYPMMKRWVEYLRAQSEGGLLSGLHFGDRPVPDAGQDIGATPGDFIATAYFALSVRTLAQAAAILGEGGDEEEYGKLYKHIRRAFRDEFVTKNGRLACPTQTAHALALHLDLLDKPARKRAANSLKALVDESGGRPATGLPGTPCLPHALTDSGLHEEACALISGMANSNQVASGSIGDWLYRNILGIAPDPSEPGFKNVIVNPLPGGAIAGAMGSFVSLYGEVAVSWKLADGQFKLDLTVPENTTATVVLPGATKRGVKESGRKLTEAEGISDIKGGGGSVVFMAGSGTYRFEYQYIAK